MERYLVDGEATFEPETVLVLAQALDDAWRSLQHTGVYVKSRAHAEATRAKLAKCIIEMAALGERDPARLRDEALAGLAESKLTQMKPRGTAL